jgi:hypothetical protein
LGVHATKIVAAVLDVETGELSWFSMSGDAAGAAGFCAGLPGPVRVAYEAGPTGYGLARELAKRGVECVVAAPSKIPRASRDRVKTDRHDAEHLVRLLVAGKLHPVRVPGPEEEALRDLVRAREQVRVDLMPPVTGFRSCCCVTGSGLMTAKRGPTVTGRGWPRSRCGGRRRSRRCWTATERSTRSVIAATPWSARSSRCFQPRRGRCRSAVAMPARRRHAHRGRVVLRDRRLRAVR